MKYFFYILLISIFTTSCTTTKGISSLPKDEPKDLVLNTKSLEKIKSEKKANLRKSEKFKIISLKKLMKNDSIKWIAKRKKRDSLHLVYEKNNQRKSIIENAENFLGTKYCWGGMSKNGMDCSALIYTAFSDNLIDVPRTSIEQSKLGKIVKTEKAKPGDLIFFRTTSKYRITHVGIITENKDGDIKFIHASTSQGVIISSLSDSYYLKSFANIKRLL